MAKEKDKNPNLWLQGLLLPSDTGKKKEASFFTVGSTRTSDTFVDAIAAKEHIADLQVRKPEVSPNIVVDVHKDKSGKGRVVTQYSRNGLGLKPVEIHLADIDLLIGRRNQALKFYVLALIKISKDALSNGKLVRPVITFTDREIRALAKYDSKNGAKGARRKAMDVLKSLELRTKVQIDGLPPATRYTPIFHDRLEFTRGGAALELSNNVDWTELTEFYTIIPVYFFELSERAALLVWYIFYVARQRLEEIATQGYFFLSFNAIQHKLQLPSEKLPNGKSNPNAWRNKEVLDNCISEIEGKHSYYYHKDETDPDPTTDFGLEKWYNDSPVIPGRIKTTDYFAKGKLKIMLKGQFAEPFIKRYNSKHKKIKQNITKKIQK